MAKSKYITVEEAVGICKKFLGCCKRIRLCNNSCDNCNWNYTDQELVKAVKVLLIEREGANG